MPNFSIGWYENHLATEGVLLQFIGTKKETIFVKNVRFSPKNNTSELTEIHPVILDNKPVLRFFEYPSPNISYDAMYFEIKQDNERGWAVHVNIKTHEIFIKQADFQIM